MSKLLTIEQTSRILNVSQNTLRIWDNKGINILPIKTKGGHRRYREDDVMKFIGEFNEEIEVDNIIVTYSRVSSHEQKTKGDLDRQSQRLSEYCAKKKYMVGYIIKDVGSGLSDSRTGFVKLVSLVIKKKINKVVIENKDRLTRFQFNLIKTFFNSYDVEIECIENNNISDVEEFANDVMTLMASFSGKLYGRRSAKRKKELKEQKLKQNNENN
ncbi:MAG: IS607 family transposase [Saccharofermentanales bacterium]